MKLLIGIPCMDFMHVDFVKSLHDLTERLHADKIDFDVKFESGTLVYLARDRIARYSIENGYTHVLWLDSDMVFKPEDFYKLRDSGKAFISGICVGRRKPHNSCLFERLSPSKRFTSYKSGVFEIAACGFAFVLVETQIIKDVIRGYKTGFLPTASYGEDLAFCVRVAGLKHTMYAHGDVKIGHIGHFAVYPT